MTNGDDSLKKLTKALGDKQKKEMTNMASNLEQEREKIQSDLDKSVDDVMRVTREVKEKEKPIRELSRRLEKHKKQILTYQNQFNQEKLKLEVYNQFLRNGNYLQKIKNNEELKGFVQTLQKIKKNQDYKFTKGKPDLLIATYYNKMKKQREMKMRKQNTKPGNIQIPYQSRTQEKRKNAIISQL